MSSSSNWALYGDRESFRRLNDVVDDLLPRPSLFAPIRLVGRLPITVWTRLCSTLRSLNARRGIPTQTYLAIIDGEEQGAKDTFEVLDPSSGKVLAAVARCGSEEIDKAVNSARATYESNWRHVNPADRATILRDTASGIRSERENLSELESKDTGKPLTQARKDVEVAARYFEFYAGAVEALFGDTISVDSDLFVFTLREPFGVTAHIIPWNYPLQVGARTVAPALATGNCCVLKPAEEAPLTALRLASLALEAGLPPGALNVVPGFGEEAGASLAAHPGIDHLAFTGSVEVGKLVAKAAAENVVPVTLELGGKSPNVVFADADLDLAVPMIVNSILQNAGQTCSAGSRLLVHEEVHKPIVEAVKQRFESATIGPGLADPDLGPLISERQRGVVAGYVETGKTEAGLVTGGEAPQSKDLAGGYYFTATLFDNVPPNASIAQQEIFGPVLAVTTFRDEAEAVRLANSTPFGLVAAVWTRDVGTAHRLAREIRAGQVFVNTYGAGGGVEFPFGGYKKSGYGREKGFEALLAYTHTKTVALRLPPLQ